MIQAKVFDISKEEGSPLSEQDGAEATTKQRRTGFLFITAGIIVLVVLTGFLIAAYKFGWGWTGFASTWSPITITSTSKGTYIAGQLQPAKTLWDWLQLLGVLAIPVVVSLAAAWYSDRHRHDLQIAQLQHENELELLEINQKETMLRVYLDQMSELLLHTGLRQSAVNDEVRNIARVRTLVVLSSLDSNCKDDVFRFLYESHLINKDNPIISLNEADLSGTNQIGANRSGTNLSRANLNSANFNGANLVGTDLRGADLRKADLIGADLSDSNLSNTNLTEANLFRANLTRANFHEASLSGVDLRYACLERANLTEANLMGADLSNAKLRGVQLTGADLSNSNLSGTDVTQEQLNTARSLKNAIGLIRDAL